MEITLKLRWRPEMRGKTPTERLDQEAHIKHVIQRAIDDALFKEAQVQGWTVTTENSMTEWQR
jgi:hypothetical protein